MPGNHPPAPSQARAGQITRRSRPWTGLLNACLPALPITPARMTHDYVRHGPTSLFAAC